MICAVTIIKQYIRFSYDDLTLPNTPLEFLQILLFKSLNRFHEKNVAVPYGCCGSGIYPVVLRGYQTRLPGSKAL